MAEFVLTGAKVWIASYDFTSKLNAVALKDGVELQDATYLGLTSRRRKAGMRTITAQYEGFQDLTTFDKETFDRIGLADQPMTVLPGASAVGDVAYFFRCTAGEYTIGGAVGEMSPISLSAEGGGDGYALVPGRLLHNAAVTSTSNGTAVQTGAVSSTQYLYAALHVTAVAGTTPTLDAIIQSDNAGGFGSPISRITFTQMNAIGSQFATRVAGAITDDYWRASFTVGGTGGPSFTVALVMGIR